ncbi:MAG: YicC family protein [Clostridia bacterium]|nr:YicC family protein [Candidatus Limimonas egerieequi]MCQ2489576.1 YicC family protein [Clostridia bacterium]
MARSMTGFGRAQSETDTLFVSVELKSVNHRYFELYSRVPRTYGFLDEKIKTYLQGRVARGKIECNVTIEAMDSDDVVVKVNHSLAKAYVDALTDLSETYGLKSDISASTLTRFPDVLSVHKEEADEDAIWEAVKGVLEAATDNFIAMREREGLKLRDDICGRADAILEKVAFVESRSPETVREYNEKLKARIAELLGDTTVDEARLLQEAAIYADKVAVDEETVRLRSHIEQLKDMFNADEAIGRKMDFLVQEINREANTIGSKASDFEINKVVVDIKAEVEKIREQVQNIE